MCSPEPWAHAGSPNSDDDGFKTDAVLCDSLAAQGAPMNIADIPHRAKSLKTTFPTWRRGLSRLAFLALILAVFVSALFGMLRGFSILMADFDFGPSAKPAIEATGAVDSQAAARRRPELRRRDSWSID
jgi:hypothetical protein